MASPAPTDLPVLDAACSSPEHSDEGLIAGRFEILRVLGDGSFSSVYEAVDRELGRRVALKLFTSYAQDELDAALREARAMARLNHEHVLSVHDIGEHRGTPFLALEFAEEDLRRWLDGRTRTSREIVELFVQAGLGLAAAHRAGLVHDDFKPANVLLRADGSAAVGDFGLARRLDIADEAGTESDEEQGYAFGTLRYIAPERLLGLPGDERSDQFSFCVAMWEALAREHPFTGSDAERRYASIAAGPKGVPRGPTSLVRALRRGLAVDPGDRFATMLDLLAAFDQRRTCRPLHWLREATPPVLTGALLGLAFVTVLGFAREAPALDAEISSPDQLVSQAAIEEAEQLTLEGRAAEAIGVLFEVMPKVRRTASAEQRDTLLRLEALGDRMSQAGAHAQAAIVYAACNNLAMDLGLDAARVLGKRSRAQTAARADAAPTRDR